MHTSISYRDQPVVSAEQQRWSRHSKCLWARTPMSPVCNCNGMCEQTCNWLHTDHVYTMIGKQPFCALRVHVHSEHDKQQTHDAQQQQTNQNHGQLVSLTPTNDKVSTSIIWECARTCVSVLNKNTSSSTTSSIRTVACCLVVAGSTMSNEQWKHTKRSDDAYHSSFCPLDGAWNMKILIDQRIQHGKAYAQQSTNKQQQSKQASRQKAKSCYREKWTPQQKFCSNTCNELTPASHIHIGNSSFDQEHMAASSIYTFDLRYVRLHNTPSHLSAHINTPFFQVWHRSVWVCASMFRFFGSVRWTCADWLDLAQRRTRCDPTPTSTQC